MSGAVASRCPERDVPRTMGDVNDRVLGRSGIRVSEIGLGCWAIGGPYRRGEKQIGWGAVDDRESTRGLRGAVELGVTLFDTADAYGCRHREEGLGNALPGDRHPAAIATEVRTGFDGRTRQGRG